MNNVISQENRRGKNGSSPKQRVHVQRTRPDMEDPGSTTKHSILSISYPFPRCIYINPLGKVTSEEPSGEFFRTARKLQAEWCRRCKTLFPRNARRSTRDWVNCTGSPRREERYMDRLYCFLGVLLLDEKMVPPGQWPDQKRKSRKGCKQRNFPNPSNGSNLTNDSMAPGSGKQKEGPTRNGPGQETPSTGIAREAHHVFFPAQRLPPPQHEPSKGVMFSE